MNAATFVSAIRHHWALFLGVFVACVAVAVGSAVIMPVNYVANTQLLVSLDGSATATAYENYQVAWERANSYVELLTSEVVNQRVVDELNLPRSAQDLAADVSATLVPPRTSVIDLAVTATSPEQARLLADTLAQQFISYSDSLERPTGADSQKVSTTIITSAGRPESDRPGPVAFGILGALAGLVLASTAVWVRERVDPAVRTAERAAAISGLPVVGCVPPPHAAAGTQLEPFRRLRTRFRRDSASVEHENEVRARVWVVTSAGKTNTARFTADLGCAMCFGRDSAVVVDANRAGAGVSEEFELDPRPGLFDVLIGSASVDEAIRIGLGGRPDVVPAGDPSDEFDDLLATDAMREVLTELGARYANIVVDTRPSDSSGAAAVLSEYADGVVLVVHAATRRRDLTRAVAELRAVAAPLIGVVFTVPDGAGRKPDVSRSSSSNRTEEVHP